MRPFTRLRLEGLENRLAPAGLIDVSVSSSGVLNLRTVPGQDGNEVVTVSRQPEGGYLLTPGVGVGLRVGGTDYFTPQSVGGVMNGLDARLGAGNDQLTLAGGSFTKSVKVDLGAGANGFTIQDCAIGGTLLVKAGAGNDTVTFAGNAVGIGGTFTAKLGDGSNLVQTNLNRATFGGFRMFGGSGNDELRVTQNDLTFGVSSGGLLFHGGLGNDLVTLGDGTSKVTVAGAVKLSARPAATESVVIGGSRFDVGELKVSFGSGTNSLTSNATEFHVARGLNWSSGSGSDTINIGGTNVRIGGALNLSVGTGFGSVRLFPSFLFIASSAVIRAGDVSGTSVFTLAANDCFIGGNVRIVVGDGASNLDLFAFNNLNVGGSVQMSQGVGSGLGRVASNSSLLVAGSVALSRSGGLGSLAVFGGFGANGALAGSVSLNGGSNQSITMSGVIGGGVNMTGAQGSQTQMYILPNGSTYLSIHGLIRMTSRSAAGLNPTMVLNRIIAESGFSISGSEGNEILQIDDCAFLGSVFANLKGGDDQFLLEQSSLSNSSTFHRPVRLLGGSGDDTFSIGGNSANDAIDFRDALKVDGGSGADTLSLGTMVTFDPINPLVQSNFP